MRRSIILMPMCRTTAGISMGDRAYFTFNCVEQKFTLKGFWPMSLLRLCAPGCMQIVLLLLEHHVSFKAFMCFNSGACPGPVPALPCRFNIIVSSPHLVCTRLRVNGFFADSLGYRFSWPHRFAENLALPII